MFLTSQQEEVENKEVINDFFGNIPFSDVRPKIEKMPRNKKDEMIEKINNHKAFYEKISQEEPRGNNFRVLTAKLRCETIYPQLLKLLQ
jgi:hypothetical protein